MNGAGIIHDFELAMAGQTSEDVAESLADGTFGMARETGQFLCAAVNRASRDSLGLGQAVGQSIVDANLPLWPSEHPRGRGPAGHPGDGACCHGHRHHPYAA